MIDDDFYDHYRRTTDKCWLGSDNKEIPAKSRKTWSTDYDIDSNPIGFLGNDAYPAQLLKSHMDMKHISMENVASVYDGIKEMVNNSTLSSGQKDVFEKQLVVLEGVLTSNGYGSYCKDKSSGCFDLNTLTNDNLADIIFAAEYKIMKEIDFLNVSTEVLYKQFVEGVDLNNDRPFERWMETRKMPDNTNQMAIILTEHKSNGERQERMVYGRFNVARLRHNGAPSVLTVYMSEFDILNAVGQISFPFSK